MTTWTWRQVQEATPRVALLEDGAALTYREQHIERAPVASWSSPMTPPVGPCVTNPQIHLAFQTDRPCTPPALVVDVVLLIVVVRVATLHHVTVGECRLYGQMWIH